MSFIILSVQGKEGQKKQAATASPRQKWRNC